MIPCALHVHSTWSDGEFTLEELRAVFLRQGVRAVFMSDHDTAFVPAQLQAYRDACAAVSDDQLRVIAGLEFTAPDRMHIVGYGVTELSPDPAPEAIFRHVSAHEGFSVLAHPRDDHFARIEKLSELPDALEVWNSKYDGKRGPRARTFALLGRLRQRTPGLLAAYGQDLHWRNQYRELITWVDATSNEPATLLGALRRGAYEARTRTLSLPSDGRVDSAVLADLDRAQVASSRTYRLLKLVAPAARLLPAWLKSHVRRYF